MANGVQNQERVPENLTKQLAVAVRSIQWSYAIFWSLSTTQQGVLEWKDGYYNGDIKTRRTAQTIELKADKVGVQRSKQLRELYESLLHEEEEEEDEEEDDTDEEAERPCAVLLSPEDLTDTEWYYLVCMSFVFNPDQGLPGRALKNGQPIWLCNAHDADSKIFSRSLLAKSASIQTVVCFPHLGGVIELGVTELVLEDPNLIQHIKASLLELSKPICSDRSSSPLDNKYDDKDPICASIDGDEMVDKIASAKFYSRTEDTKHDQDRANELEENTDEDYSGGSRDDCSRCSEQNDHTEYLNLNGSINSSHCASQDFVNQAKANSPLKVGNIYNLQLSELQECNDYLHYRRTVLTILRNSQQSIGKLCSCDSKSSFLSWKKGGKVDDHRPMDKQSMLKKILFNVPLMNGGCTTEENSRKIGSIKKENDNIYAKHAFPKNRMENEKFLVLGSMVPSISKINKASILDDTIEYLKELEERIKGLESGTDLTKSKERTGMTCLDMAEEISDNYENKRLNYGTTPRINKRKACDIDGTETELNSVGLPLDMKVQISEEGVLIEMRCRSREYLLLDIIDALNNLDLDAHSVQSCTLDGVLTLTLRSKVRGEAVASATMIKQALKKVAGNF